MAALNSVVKEGPQLGERQVVEAGRVMQVTGKTPQAESAKGKPSWGLAGGTVMNTRTRENAFAQVSVGKWARIWR